MVHNIIKTFEEYMKEGFSAEEAPLIQEHDILFNKYQDGECTEAEAERMFKLVEILGL